MTNNLASLFFRDQKRWNRFFIRGVGIAAKALPSINLALKTSEKWWNWDLVFSDFSDPLFMTLNVSPVWRDPGSCCYVPIGKYPFSCWVKFTSFRSNKFCILASSAWFVFLVQWTFLIMPSWTWPVLVAARRSARLVALSAEGGAVVVICRGRASFRTASTSVLDGP